MSAERPLERGRALSPSGVRQRANVPRPGWRPVRSADSGGDVVRPVTACTDVQQDVGALLRGADAEEAEAVTERFGVEVPARESAWAQSSAGGHRLGRPPTAAGLAERGRVARVVVAGCVRRRQAGGFVCARCVRRTRPDCRPISTNLDRRAESSASWRRVWAAAHSRRAFGLERWSS